LCFFFRKTKMPKNKGKGGKSKRKGKNKNDEGDKRELMVKEEGQEYAQVVKILGNCRVEAFCFDGATRIAHVRGKFRKKVWINRDDIILVGLRDYQDTKCDVIHKFTAEEARRLKAKGELPAKTRIGIDPDVEDGEDDLVDFDEVSEEEEEEEKDGITLDAL
jgi:translation initiation factor 1A